MHLTNRVRRWLPWLLLGIAVIVTAVVYWPGVTGGWVFDDFPNIVDNVAIHITPGHSTLVAWVNSALSSPSSFLHRPLASLTFSLNWYFGGGNPWGFKVVNILIHLANGVLLFCMLRELLRLRARMRGAPTLENAAATRLALVVSAAWLLLPINLMAVLYVVQRMESLCQVFVLAGLWMYLVGRRRMLTATTRGDDARGLSLAIAGIVVGTVLGLTSKETAVLLPVFAFLVEAVVLRFQRAGDDIPPRLRRDPLPAEGGESSQNGAIASERGEIEAPTTPPPSERRGIEGDGFAACATDKRIWTLFTVTLFIPGILGFLWLLRGALRPAAWAGRDFTLLQRVLTEPRVLVDYLHWTLLPNPMVLSLYHDEIVKSTSIIAPWTTLGSMLLLAALIAIAVWLRKRRPLVTLGIGWFFAGQLLTATIVPLELVYEQRMYFSSIGVLLAVGALLLGLRKSIWLSMPRVFVVGVALLWFGTATNLRAQEWSNPLTLAIKEANRHPTSGRAVYEAGRLLLIASSYAPGKLLDESRKYLDAAAAIPGSSSLPEQGLIMIADHRHHGADVPYWQSMTHKLASQPTRQEDISALIALGNCYASGICEFNIQRLQRAYQAALSRPHPTPRLYGAYSRFAHDLLHNDAAAMKYLALAVQGAPDEPAYRVDFAALLIKHGEMSKARAQIDALRQMNYAGRLDGQIATLKRLAGTSEPARHR